MKIIVLGDIHANLRALRRALEEADAEGFDAIVHTGDIAGFGPHLEEVVGLLASRGIEGVRGNLDEVLAAGESQPRAPLLDESITRLAGATLDRSRRSLSPRARRYLSDLPFEIRLQAGSGEVVLYHANPFDLTTYFPPDAPEPAFEACLGAARAQVVVTGHLHTGFHRGLLEGHFVGASSVGLPRDGDPRAGYTVIRAGRAVQVEHRRFAYEIEEAVREGSEGGMEEEVAERWRLGR